MKSKVVLGLALIVGLVAMSCQNKDSAVNNTLTVGLAADIVALDPAYGYDNATNAVINQITEGLLAYDVNNQVVPKLAKSWKAVDPTTYVYDIRDNVTFSDGTPLSVDDVLFSLDRYKDPATASYVQWIYANVKSIEKTGDWQITVKLKTPDALWPDAFATTGGHIISKAYFQAHKDNFGKPEGGVLGTGPFVFKTWTTGSEIVLEKNPKYWDTSKTIEANTIVYKIIPENIARISALKAGQVDVVNNPPLDLLDQIKDNKDLNLTYIDSFYFTFVAFNTERAPFNDPNVRRAIYSAIDRDSIYKNIVKDAGAPSVPLPFGPGLWTFAKDKWADYTAKVPQYSYNLEKAKEYLAKTKVAKGFKFTLIQGDDTVKNAIALSIQETLKQLNIEVTIQKVTPAEAFGHQFGGKLKDGKRDYDALLSGWVSDFPDPAGNITPLYAAANRGQGGSNAAAYNNPVLDKLLDQQAQAQDEGSRFDLLTKATDIIADQVPYVILYYPKSILASNARISLPYSASWLYNLFYSDVKFTK